MRKGRGLGAAPRGSVSLTRSATFRASHRLARPDWSDARNRAVFGDVSGPPHAHQYRCDVTVSGPVDGRTGTLVDLRVLDAVIAAEIVGRLDGRTLNELDELRRGAVVPTSENLARLIAGVVRRALRDRRASARVTEVRVAEDDTLSATWRAAR